MISFYRMINTRVLKAGACRDGHTDESLHILQYVKARALRSGNSGEREFEGPENSEGRGVCAGIDLDGGRLIAIRKTS